MLAIERRREITAKLTAEGKVIVSELAREFGVTEETIRRDLERLDNDGIASKTYGGAVARNASTLDLPYNVREGVNVEEKQNIAEKLASLITDGERIMLDSSSTALYIVKKLKDKKNLTIIPLRSIQGAQPQLPCRNRYRRRRRKDRQAYGQGRKELPDSQVQIQG